MCGRFAQNFTLDLLKTSLPALEVHIEYQQRSNIAPSQVIPTIVANPTTQLVSMDWGIKPGWDRPDRKPPLLINARAETLSSRKTFSLPFKETRCLVPMSGYYEWKELDGKKRPHYIFSPNEAILLASGIFTMKETHQLPSCAIITRKAVDSVSTIHDRMPAFIRPEHVDKWLKGDTTLGEELLALSPPLLEFARVESF